jgi:hypothetical protein
MSAQCTQSPDQKLPTFHVYAELSPTTNCATSRIVLSIAKPSEPVGANVAWMAATSMKFCALLMAWKRVEWMLCKFTNESPMIYAAGWLTEPAVPSY